MLREFIYLLRRIAVALLLAAPVPASAAKFYVDSRVGDLAEADRTKVAAPGPVQLLFQFSTDGKPNAAATKYLKDQVFELARGSGLFTEISETPVASSATANITINNITEKGAASKGFRAGFTLGLAGTVVADRYDVVVAYFPRLNDPAVQSTAQHAIMTKIGAKGAPENATVVKNPEEAIRTVVRQTVARCLNALAGTTAFGGTQAEAVNFPLAGPETAAPSSDVPANKEAAPGGAPAVDATPAQP